MEACKKMLNEGKSNLVSGLDSNDTPLAIIKYCQL